MGLLGAYAFPIRLGDDCIGALNVYRDRPGSFDDDIALAQAFADVASIGILQRRRAAAAEDRATQLQHALDSRVVIEQAKGVLAERRLIDVDEAFRLLRHTARHRNRRLHDVRNDVVAGRPLNLPQHQGGRR